MLAPSPRFLGGVRRGLPDEVGNAGDVGGPGGEGGRHGGLQLRQGDAAVGPLQRLVGRDVRGLDFDWRTSQLVDNFRKFKNF